MWLVVQGARDVLAAVRGGAGKKREQAQEKQEASQEINNFVVGLNELKNSSTWDFKTKFDEGIHKCFQAARILGEPLRDIVQRNGTFKKFNDDKNAWFVAYLAEEERVRNPNVSSFASVYLGSTVIKFDHY